jgi:hypothetical protein
MTDPVALAYSGRLEEARAAALVQARSDDPFLAAQGLEALAVLGQQHGVRADEPMTALLVQRAADEWVLARKAFEAATALGVREFDRLAAQRLASGGAGWEVLRYAGEWPSQEVAEGLAAGWALIPERLLDEALLTACVQPAATRREAEAWGARAVAALRHASEDVRRAAVTAVLAWRPADALTALEPLREDESESVRSAAGQALETLERERRAAKTPPRRPRRKRR